MALSEGWSVCKVIYLLLACLLLVSANSDVYLVTMEGDPVVGMISSNSNCLLAHQKLLSSACSQDAKQYSDNLVLQHDFLLKSTFSNGTYMKLYSYRNVINGFAVQLTSDQAETLGKLPNVLQVEKDWQVKKMTTHTPDFLGLPTGIWPLEGGAAGAGEGVVIGIIDTGIDPTHPSFSAESSPPYSPVSRFRGHCEAAFGSFCNGKIVKAQHFSLAAEAAGALNSSSDFTSPLDGDGHGSHTASIAAGNHGVPVTVNGFYFGNASGMAPRARLAVYKALYRYFGGFVADVVAAIDQAVEDGVDVLNLSVGPSNRPSSSQATFLNAFDVALLTAVRAGIFVVQAAGNGGPYPRTMASFSPWIMSVAAGLDDRNYLNWIVLGNGESLSGAGLAPPTPGNQSYIMILAEDALTYNFTLSLNPLSCQQPEAFNTTLVQGKILICTYSFNFLFGESTVKQVSRTAQNLSAAGFVLIVKTRLPGIKFKPVPMAVPGIILTNFEESESLINYYNASTIRDSRGNITHFGAEARIGNGLMPSYNCSAPQVAIYSSRGPDVKDYDFQDADVLKPNILAPGSLIWAAWSSIGIDEPDFQGEAFALMSGTSMAAPHIAGIAALLKQKYPTWSSAAIASAMMTTASAVNNKGEPLLAQHLSPQGAMSLEIATPFDFGSGAVNATAALDPGLIFDAGYDDYISFICALTGINPIQVSNITGSSCKSEVTKTTDLNIPSIVIANLVGVYSIRRTVTNVAATETYAVSSLAPTGILLNVYPTSFTIAEGQSISLTVTMNATSTNYSTIYSFGQVSLSGNKHHRVCIPIAVRIGKNR